jgi:hypothetical protein
MLTYQPQLSNVEHKLCEIGGIHDNGLLSSGVQGCVV